jgi:site-specific recombinase XerD
MPIPEHNSGHWTPSDGPRLPAEIGPSPAAVAPTPEIAAAVTFARAEKAEATRRAYRTDFEIFRAWCNERKVAELPATAEAVAAFIAFEASRAIKPSTIARRVAAIRYAHKLAGHESPTNAESVRATLRGIRRTMGVAPIRKVPITSEHIRAMAAAAPDTLAGLRDRALLLLGFAGALRRSEIVALNVDDLEEIKGGLCIRIARSKTDQEGQGTVIAIVPGAVACPIKSVKAWLIAAKITNGPLFRSIVKGGRATCDRLSAKSVADIIKTYAKRIGLDAKSVGGHSLRAGFLTSAAARGASIFKMMDVSRHRSVDTLQGYVREADRFRDHAGTGLL